MKIWTQDMLPLKIIKDLGLEYASPTSKAKTRFISFECPHCKQPFKATPSKVKTGVITCCGKCGHSRRSIKVKDNKLQCSKCNVIKELSDFYKNKKTATGYDTRCKSCMDSYKQSWLETKHPNYLELVNDNSRLMKRYGITSDDYNVMLQEQNYSCAICGNTAEHGRGNTSKLSVDHCHDTGKVRGLLCQKCNTGLGLLGDNIEGLQKAINYLGK